MLTLTRNIGEKIQIGNNVTLEVIQINGTGVQLGIEAPKHMSILRDDVKNKAK
jgi:carbon storage regulator